MNTTKIFNHKSGVLVIAILMMLSPGSGINAQQATGLKVSGTFRGGSKAYNSMPIVAGLTDASGYFGKDPLFIPAKGDQVIAQTTGSATQGTYELQLPDKPAGRPINGNANMQIFDVRLMSDAAHRGYLASNEDIISSSLRLDVDLNVLGGTLITWSANNDQQLDLGSQTGGPKALPIGWSVLNLDTKQVSPIANLNLITAGAVDVVDYTKLACGDLVPAFLDRVQKFYPFTELHHIDWDALRAKLIPAAKAAKTDVDCQKVIRDFGNAIPDGHVDYTLPALNPDWAGSAGLVLSETTAGDVVVAVVRAGGPAAQAGVQPGAIVSQWGGQPVADALKAQILQYANSSTPQRLLAIQLSQLPRGPLGGIVSITFQNPGEQPKTAIVTRDTPQRVNTSKAPPEVKNNMLPSGVGYIRINDFIDGTFVTTFDQAVDSLIKANAPAIIIDVRSNPGGFSQVSDALAGRFFSKDFIVGKQFTPDGRWIYVQEVSPRPPLYTGCVELLVDYNTASAGDLFSYTFKSAKRAIVVGHTASAGMAGTVSGGVYLLPGDASIQVPTGAFFDASGNIIVEGTGIAPDVVVPQTVESIISPADDVLAAAVAATVQCSVQK